MSVVVFFFKADEGIGASPWSRGLGYENKRQGIDVRVVSSNLRPMNSHRRAIVAEQGDAILTSRSVAGQGPQKPVSFLRQAGEGSDEQGPLRHRSIIHI